MKLACGSRRISVASALTGVSMMRFPRGYISLPSVRKRPFEGWVFGAILDSTTLIHGVHFIEPKYAAAAAISSSVMFFANWIMRFVLFLRGSALFRFPFLKSLIVWMKYSDESPLTPAFSARP